MSTQRPTLRQLEYLVAVSETLNFRQAAEKCFVTQPALSTQLQQLEEILGVKVFERDKRQVLPTPAGRALSAAAKQLLRDSDAFVDLASSFADPLTGHLRLGVIPTVGPYLLPRVLDAVQESYPELKLYLREDQTARLVRRLEDGELDLLLLALDVELGRADSMPLFEDPFVLACPKDHPLAGKELVTEQDLEGVPILLLEEGHCLRQHALPLCQSAGADELLNFRASSLSTLVQMVASGIGVTLLPEMAVAQESSAAKGLVTRPFDVGGPGRRIGLAWRGSTHRADEYRALGEVIAKAYMAS